MSSHSGMRYKRWSNENMVKAMEAVSGGRSVKSASKEFGVPRRSLDDRVNGKVASDARAGRKTILSADHEMVLIRYITYMASRAFPLTINLVMMFAWAIDRSIGGRLFGPNGPSYCWWARFRDAHPEVNLRLRRPDYLDRSRVSCSNVTAIQEYFQLLKSIFDKFDLHHKPERIWNCDETILNMNKSTQKVIVPVRQKHAHSRQIAVTEHVSVHCSVSAAGVAMPPYIIFSGAFPGGNYAKNGPDGALYGKSDSGFMDTELMVKWFTRIFLKHCPSDRTPENPVLLLLDGHASHCAPELIEAATRANVILFALVPHSTHLCQPLDVSVYKILKSCIGRTIKVGQALRGSLWIAKKDVPRIFKEPFERCMSIHAIKEGFRKCGIYPFNPNAIDKEQLLRSRIDGVNVQNIDLSAPPSISKSVGVQASPEDLLESGGGDSSVNKTAENNILVRTGIVPPEMAEIFFAPDEEILQGRKRPLRVKSKARVMTGSEVLADLERQRSELIEKNRKKEERKRKAAERKEQKAKKVRGGDEAGTSRSRSPVQDERPLCEEDWGGDDSCCICKDSWEDEEPDRQIMWVGCSTRNCPNWICPSCLEDDFDYGDDFYCTFCV